MTGNIADNVSLPLSIIYCLLCSVENRSSAVFTRVSAFGGAAKYIRFQHISLEYYTILISS